MLLNILARGSEANCTSSEFHSQWEWREIIEESGKDKKVGQIGQFIESSSWQWSFSLKWFAINWYCILKLYFMASQAASGSVLNKHCLLSYCSHSRLFLIVSTAITRFVLRHTIMLSSIILCVSIYIYMCAASSRANINILVRI